MIVNFRSFRSSGLSQQVYKRMPDRSMTGSKISENASSSITGPHFSQLSPTRHTFTQVNSRGNDA